MQNPTSQNSSPIIELLATIIQFGIVGFVGSVPIGLLVTFIYGPIVGREIWLMGAMLVGSYFPLRSLAARLTHKAGAINYIPGHLNISMLVIAAFGFLLMTPLLWMFTFFPMIGGLLAYAISESNIWIALLVALTLHIFNIYRENQNSEAFTATFNMNFQDISRRFGADTLVLDDDDIEVHTVDGDDTDDDTYLEEGVIYHLPATSNSGLNLSSDDEDIIIIEPDSDKQQDEQ